MLTELEQQYFVTVRDLADRFLFGDMTPNEGMRIALDVAILANASAFLEGAETRKWWLLDEDQQISMAGTLRSVADVFRDLRTDVDGGRCYQDTSPLKVKLLLTTRLLRQSWERGAMATQWGEVGHAR